MKAGEKIVIEAGMELTVKAGGITMIGPIARVNAGGSAGIGTGIGIKPSRLPGVVDRDKAGSLTDPALVNEPL